MVPSLLDRAEQQHRTVLKAPQSPSQDTSDEKDYTGRVIGKQGTNIQKICKILAGHSSWIASSLGPPSETGNGPDILDPSIVA